MAVERRKCTSCGNGFLGTPRAQYCSTACRQKAHRRRSGRNRNADRNATVTVAAPVGSPARSAEAAQVLAGLDAELAENSRVLGRPLTWSTADQTVRELIADTIERRADLMRRYDASEDDKAALKLSAEIRLLERAVAQLLKQVRTDMPAPPSKTAMKAAHAANVRWGRDA